MKKFIIFFLMAFLLLSNGHIFAEKSTHTLANKLTVDRIDHVDGVDGVAHDETIPLVTTPAGPVTITEGTTLTFSSTITPAPGRIWGSNRNQRQTRIIVNGVEGSFYVDNGSDQPAEMSYTFDTPGTYTVQIEFRHRERPWFSDWGPWTSHFSNTITVNVLAIPTITGPDVVCQGSDVTLTATDYPGFTYQWYANGVKVGPSTAGSTFTVPTDNVGSITYSVALVLNGTIGTPSAGHPVQVVALPTVHVGGGTDVYCGSSANITINPTYNPTSGLSYQWYLDGAAIPAASGGTTANLVNYPVSAQSNLYDFHVVATSTTAPYCSNEPVHKFVRVYEVPTFDITPSVEHACVGGSVTLIPSNEVSSGYSYQWYNAENDLVGTEFTHTFITVEGNNTYKLKVTHTTYDCTAEVSYTFTADAVPTVALSATENICVGDKFELTATPTPAEAPHEGAYTYTWYRGGTALVGPSGPTFSDGPMAVGTYNYTATVSSNYPGCSGTSNSISVTVHDLANPTISGTTNSCDGKVDLTIANYYENSTVTWYDGENVVQAATLTPTGAKLHLTGVSNGTHNYRAVVEAPSTLGGCVEEVEYEVNVYQFPATITLTADPDVNEACEGGEITFTPNPPFALADFDYEWQQGGAPNGFTDASCTYTMGNAELEVNLRLTHKASGCQTKPDISRTITFRAQPTMLDPSIALEPNRENICVDHRMVLTARVNGTPADYTYEWFRTTPDLAYDGTLPSITEVAVHNPGEEVYPVGTYTYSVVATDKVYPGCSVGDEIEINVHEKPVIEIAGNTVYCEVPANVILEAQGELASSTYQWYVDGLEINPGGTAKQLNHLNNIPQAAPYIYSVEVTAPDLNGACVSTAQVEVVVDDNIQVTLGTPAVTTVCVGGQVELEVTDAHLYPGANYIWYRNGIAISTLGLPNFSDIYDTPGTYTYNVVGQISPGCETPPSESVVITVLDAPTATNFAIGPVDPIPGNTICDGGQITLGITDQTFDPTIPYIYAWYRNGVMIPNANMPTLTDSPLSVDQDSTYYTYNLVLISGDVCEMTADYTILVKRNPVVELVTAPNVCDVPNNIVVSIAVDGETGYFEGGHFFYKIDGVIQYDESNLGGHTFYFGPRNYPYTFQVEYIAPNGCNSFSNVAEVMVHARPEIEILAEETPICVGGDIDLTATLGNYSLAAEYTYQWYRINTNDANAIPGATLPEFSEVATTAGTHTYWLIVDNYAVHGTGSELRCHSQQSVNIVVEDIPTVELEVNVGEICDGGQLTLTTTVDGGVPGGEVYTWYRNGVIIEGATQPVLNDSPTTVDQDTTYYTYTVEVAQTASGCQSVMSESVTVLVKRNPVVELVANPNVCDVADNIILSTAIDGETGAIPGVFYYTQDGVLHDTIHNNGGKIFTMGPRNYPYVYQVEYYSPNGCNAFSNTVEVMVHEKPEFELFVEESPICIGGDIDLSVTLSNYSISHDYTYQWYKDGTDASDAIPGATLPAYHEVATAAGTYVYYLAVDNYAVHAPSSPTFRCHAIKSIEVVVNEDPTIELAISAPVICEGGEVTLTATVTGGVPETPGVTPGMVYSWYKNDVLVPEATDAVYVDYPVTVDGDVTTIIYRVEVTQTASGCASVIAATQTLEVNPNPSVQIEGDPIICQGTNITLTANVNDAYDGANLTYQWRLFNADLAHATATTATYSDSHPGSDNPYIFTVVVTNAHGCTTESAPFEVYVNIPPVVEITATENHVCVGGEVTLTAHLEDYNAPDLVYRWYANDVELYGATEATYTTVMNATTVFKVVVDQITSGCSDFDEFTVTVEEDPVIAIAIDEPVICEGGEVVLTATITGGGVAGGEVYRWYKNDVLVEGATAATYIDYPVTVDGDVTQIIYRVEVTQTAAGCASVNVAQTTLEIHPNPSVQIEGDPIICDGSPVSLTANVNDEYDGANLTYQWRLFNADIEGATSPTYTFTYPDTIDPYIFTVVVTNPNGCRTESAPFFQYVNTAPVVEVTATETEICEGGEVTMVAHLGDYNSPNLVYQWYTVDGGVETPIHGASEISLTIIPTTTTTYRVRVIQTISACEAYGDVTINVAEDPEITVEIDESVICEGGEVTLTATVTGGVAGGEVYKWYKNDVLVPGAYAATLVDYPVTVDGDMTTIIYRVEVTQTAAGCASVNVAETTLEIYPNPSVQIEGDPIICDGTDISLTANVNDEYPGSNLTYQWRLFNANLTGATDANLTLSRPGSDNPYIFTVVVSNALGCTTESAPFAVYVNIPPVVEVTATEEHICEGGEVTLTAHLEDYNAPDLVYRWSANGTEVYGATESTLTIIPDGTTVYEVEVLQTTSGCVSTDDITINVYPDPIITEITISEDQICSGGQVTIEATTTPLLGTPTFTWYRNGILLPEVTTAVFTESPEAIDGDVTLYTYSAFVTTDVAGCQSDITESPVLTVYDNPVVVISGDANICETDSVFLTAFVDHVSDPVGILSYTWFESGQTLENSAYGVNTPHSQNLVDYFAPRYEPYVFTVRVTRENGCTTLSEPFELYVHESPVVNITASENPVCETGEVTLTANLDDYNTDMITYQWYTETYNTYPVYTGPDTFVEVTDTIKTPIPGATQQQYTTVVDETSAFYVRVLQTHSLCEKYDRFVVEVIPTPVVTEIIISDATICEGGEVTISAVTDPADITGAIYTWYQNGILMEGISGASFTHSPLAVDNDITTYEYSVSVSAPVAGCTSDIFTATELLTVYGNPTVVIEGNPLVCEDSLFTLIANINDTIPGTTVTYQWRRFNEDIPGATARELTTSEPFEFGNTYMYTVVVNTEYDNGTIGCVRESEPFYVVVGENPIVEIIATDNVACEGGAITLTAVLGNPYLENIAVTWYRNGEPIYGAHSLTYTAIITETSTFYAVVSSNGCTATTEEITITMIPTPTIGAVVAYNTTGGSDICEGGEVEVTAYLEGPEGNYIDSTATYTWYRNGFLMPLVTGPWFRESLHAIDGDTTHYTYSVIVTSESANCVSGMGYSNTVTVIRNPIVIINGNHEVCQAQGYTPNVYLSGYINGISDPDETTIFKWYKNGVYQENPSFQLYYTEVLGLSYQTVTYMLEVINGNGCSAFSEPFEVFVHPNPVVNITTEESTVCVGGQVTLQGNLNDYNEDEYVFQWYRNGISVNHLIPGATQMTYTTPPLTESATYYFRVIQRNTGCVDFDIQYITVVEDPVIEEVTVSATEVCHGAEVTVSAVTTNVTGTPIYTWYRNGQLIEGATGPSVTQTLYALGGDQSTYTYAVSVRTEHSGCESSLAVAPVITVTNDPHVVIAGEPVVCAGENNIVLHANSVPSTGMNYQWFLNNVAIDGATDATLVTTQPASTTPYIYSVLVSGAPGCDAMSATFEVIVNDAPIVTVTADAALICEGGEVTFTATIDNWNLDMLTYQWYHNGELIPGATNLTYTTTINDVADHTYSIVVDQLTSGCSGTDAVTVTVVADPVITSVEISEPFICDGGQVTITANTEGLVGEGIYTWYRNGELIEGVTGAQFLESPLSVDGDVTTYSYSAVVTSTISGCNSAMVTSPILTVYGNPVVGISGDAHICEDEPVNLMAFVDHVSDPVGNLTYTWFESGQQRDNLVNGIPVNSQVYLEYWYPSDQPYVFTVRVTRDNGCTTLSDPFYVYVHEKPVVNITATDEAVCEGGEVTLTANLDDYNTSNITYQWFTQTIDAIEVQISATEFVTVYDTVITNIAGATTQTYTTVVDETTVYGVLVNQTISGCTATDLVTITATTVPVVTEILITPSAEICDGGQVTLTAVTEGGVVGGEVYTWYRNGIIIPGANTATIIESPLAVDGDLTLYNYTVQVTQTASGCTSLISDPAVVTVYPTPTVQVAVNGNTTICEGGTVELIANVNPTNTNTTYQWFVDNVLIPGATDQTYIITDAVARETDYIYTVQVTQYIGCNVTSAPVAITVVADPEVVVTIDDPVICVGGTTTLYANVTNGVSGVNGLGNYTYNWYSTNSPETSLGTAPTLVVTGTTEQTTTYWVEVTSPYGCNTTAYYYNFEVIADPTVTVAVAAGYSEEVCEGGQTMLAAYVQGGLGTPSYQWYKNGNLLPGETNATIMTDPLYSSVTATYSVNVVMSTVGCDATNNFEAHTIVVPAPVVDITGNTNTCPGGTVTLTAVVSGGVANDNYSYQWYRVSNGISTAINGATTSVYTTSPLLLGDSYEYYVTINSFVSGCSASSGTVEANVVPEPTVSITGANAVCEGGVLTLTALVQGGIQPVNYTYTWTYQQGTNSGSYQTTTPVFQLPATLPANDAASPYVFNVSVMSDNFHCDAVSASHIVNIYAVPSVTITLDHSVVCSGGSVTATAHVTPVGTYNYVWTVNGTVQGINAATLTMNNLPIGNNDISVAVTPNNADAACHGSANAVVTVVADPVVTIASDVTTLCAGGTVNLTVQSIVVDNSIPDGSYTYEWRVNGVLIPNVIGNSLSQTLTTPGTYVYALRVIMNNGLGCGSDWSNEIVVTVAPQPVVTINPAGLGILDLCVGGEVTLSATVTNSNSAHGTYTYTWYSNNTNTGVSTNPYNQTLNEVGTYNYYVVVDASGSACAPVASNVITYNIVADPTWTAISVLYPEICVGETVQLNAAVQGGVQDGSGNTNGVIHWTVWAEGGDAEIVDGGIGGTSFDTPDAAGQYYYQPTYIGQLGSGCNIEVNPVTPVVVHERPTIHFADGDGTVICGNDPNSFATVVVELTGTAPFTFTLTGSNGYSEMFTTSLNTFPIYLNPFFTGSYTITHLHDANCDAVDYPAPITIIVSHVEVLDLVAETCGETEDGSLPTVQIDVNVTATSPGMTPIAYISYLTDHSMDTQSPIYYTGSRTYIEFTTPIVPGDYPIIITIDGCDYHATVRVLIGQYNLGGTDALMQQRWDDVVVVNNNPETNGGYTFVTYQWYKDGVEIPGATHQYYQELGGLNGFYSVKLTAETEDGLVEFKTCEQFFVSQNLTKIYPVPANVEETVTIEVNLTAEELEGAVLDIFDAKGALVRQLPVEDIIIRVDGFQTPGAYFGRITTGTNEIKTVKFVIVK